MFQMQHSDETLAVWPHKFQLNYIVELEEGGTISTELRCKNTDDSVWKCQTLLHTYCRIPDITTLEVSGFKNIRYVDQLNPYAKNKNAILAIEKREKATVDCEVDRILHDDLINNKIPDIRLDYTGNSGSCCTLLIKKEATYDSGTGNDTNDTAQLPCDVVFWNAWVDKCKSLGDMDNDAYKNYVCIEPGTVSNFVPVESNAVLSLKQTLTAL